MGKHQFRQSLTAIREEQNPVRDRSNIPLNLRSVTALTFWMNQFPERQPERYVFPKERYEAAGRQVRAEGISDGIAKVAKIVGWSPASMVRWRLDMVTSLSRRVM
jgi:hypothetical protein